MHLNVWKSQIFLLSEIISLITFSVKTIHVEEDDIACGGGQ